VAWACHVRIWPILLTCHPCSCATPGQPQGRQLDALNSFAEDVYYCSLEFGPEDPRTSLGFYNMGKVCVCVHVCVYQRI